MMHSSDKVIYVRLSYNNNLYKESVPLSHLANLHQLKLLVRKWLFLPSHAEFSLQRKSKRADRYINLETAKDFKSLLRSFEVKATLKLKVISEEKDGIGRDNSRSIRPQTSYSDLITTRTSALNLREMAASTAALPLVQPPIPGTDQDGRVLFQELKALNLKLDDIQFRMHQEKMSCQMSTPTSPQMSVHRSISSNNKLKRKSSSHLITVAAAAAKPELNTKDDLFIDIPFTSEAYRTTLVDFISKFDTADKLVAVAENNRKYERLLELTKGDADALYKIVKHAASRKNEQLDPHVHVAISIVQQRLKIVLTNNDMWNVPSNTKLELQVLDNEGVSAYTVNLFLGDNMMKRHSQRTIFYRLDGIDHAKVFKNGPVKLIIKNEDDSIYRIGYGKGVGLGEVIMREKHQCKEYLEEKARAKKNKQRQTLSENTLKGKTPSVTQLRNEGAVSTEGTDESGKTAESVSSNPVNKDGEVNDSESLHSSDFATPAASAVFVVHPDVKSETSSQKSVAGDQKSVAEVKKADDVTCKDAADAEKKTDLSEAKPPSPLGSISKSSTSSISEKAKASTAATSPATSTHVLTMGNISYEELQATRGIPSLNGNMPIDHSTNTITVDTAKNITTVHPPEHEIITDFSELSDNENGVARHDDPSDYIDDYDILSDHDYSSDHTN